MKNCRLKHYLDAVFGGLSEKQFLSHLPDSQVPVRFLPSSTVPILAMKEPRLRASKQFVAAAGDSAGAGAVFLVG